MSSQSNISKAPERKDYVVQAAGPINVRGALKRKDDVVSLTEKEAKSYGALVKLAPKPAQKSEGSKGKV